MAKYPDRSQLQKIVGRLSEGVLLIEPDQVITYANKAALDMHGASTIAALGHSIDEYLAKFEFRTRTKQPIEVGRTPVELAAAGEQFEQIVVEVRRRDNPKVDWCHSVRSLVLKTPKDQPDCVVLFFSDISGRVEAEDRFDKMFSANPAPAAICRLSDLRFVAINEGFLQLTGFKRESVIGHTVYEIDVLERAEQRDLAIQCLKSGETIPQMEACLRLPGGRERFVIVAGQPLEIGAEPCMLFTFADLEDRRKAEMALVRSEERFVKAFRLSPVPTMVGTVDEHRFIDVNEAFAKVTGYGIEELVGRCADDLQLWAVADTRRQFESDFNRTGSVRSFEAKLHTKGKFEIDCVVSAEMVTINDETCVLCVFQDITERKRSESELIEAIEGAMADTKWFSRGVIEKLAALRELSGPVSSAVALSELTSREQQIVHLICGGVRDGDIGTKLKLSHHTIRNHVASLYKKIGVNRRSDVVIWARERGLDGASSKQVAPKAGKLGK